MSYVLGISHGLAYTELYYSPHVRRIFPLSQVIVTQDNLLERRQLSRDQEHKIETNEQFAKWRRSDITGPDPVRKVLGLAAIPVLGLWVVLGAIVGAAMGLLRALFRLLGQMFGGSKDLISGGS